MHLARIIAFQLKYVVHNFWQCAMGCVFIFLNIFFITLIGIQGIHIVFVVLLLSIFINSNDYINSDQQDGTFVLVRHSQLSLEWYYALKLMVGWGYTYIMQCIAVICASIFMDINYILIGKLMLLWIPMSISLSILVSGLARMTRTKGLQFILTIPLILPQIIFFQEALHSALCAMPAQLLYATCAFTTITGLICGLFFVQRY